MQVIRDDWTPLFHNLQAQLQPYRRQILLARLIGKIQDITQRTMGTDGENRPEPWQILKKKYADRWKGGDTTPTLLMDDAEHALRNPGLPHLIDSFESYATPDVGVLTNNSPYADTHQLGYGNVPARPYYPVEGGVTLTPFAIEKMREILDAHFEAS